MEVTQEWYESELASRAYWKDYWEARARMLEKLLQTEGWNLDSVLSTFNEKWDDAMVGVGPSLMEATR